MVRYTVVEIHRSAAIIQLVDDLLGREVSRAWFAEKYRHDRQAGPGAAQPVTAQNRSSPLLTVGGRTHGLGIGSSGLIEVLIESSGQNHRASLCYYLRMHADNRTSGSRLPDDQTALIVEVFRMLADATRVQILWALADGELSVNELADRVAKPAPSVSQHLAKLRMARLVRTRREGTQVIYRLENDHVRQLVTDAVYNAEHAGPGVPRHHRGDTDLRALDATKLEETQGNVR